MSVSHLPWEVDQGGRGKLGSQSVKVGGNNDFRLHNIIVAHGHGVKVHPHNA